MDYTNHFKDWLKQNLAENSSARSQLQQQSDKEQESDIEQESDKQKTINSASDIAFEDENMKLIVQKQSHKKEKRFRLQDHLFHFRIIPKQNGHMPLVINILNFLHAAFIHVLESIKSFYNKGEQICYQSLFFLFLF